mgnify:CR=1 FL=1
MSQHTPGPWQVNGSTISGRDPVGEREDYNESPICTISHGWRNREIDNANARLIAQAPEMLTMLASCLAYFDNMRNGGYAAATPDAAWTAPIRALLKDIEEGRP